MEYFKLEEYEFLNWEHRRTLIELTNDINVRTYFNDFERYVNNIIEHGKENNINKAYVVSKEDEIVGMIMIDYLDPRYYISYALLPNKRHERLGTLLLSDFVEYLFQSGLDIDKLFLEINASNVASIKTALNVGFQRYGKTGYYISNYHR